MAAEKRVLVIDDSPAMLELNRILLSAEGYEVLTSSYAEVSMAFIKERAPQAILFDLVKDQSASWALLAELRKEPETRDIGVMVTSASTVLLKRALDDTSLGVSSGLLIPFEVDDLYTCLDETINHTQGARAAEEGPDIHDVAYRRLAHGLRRQHRTILFRWVQRAGNLAIFQRHASLDLEEMAGEIGRILEAAIAQLEQLGNEHAPQSPGAETSRDAERHGRARRALGERPGELVHEFLILRMELTRALGSQVSLGRMDATDVLAAQACLDETLDHLLIACIEGYEMAQTEHDAPMRLRTRE